MIQGLESLLELLQPLVFGRQQCGRRGARGGVGDDRILLFLPKATSMAVVVFGSAVGISTPSLLLLLG